MPKLKLNRADRKHFTTQKSVLKGTILCRGTCVPLRTLLMHLSLGCESHEIQRELPDVTKLHMNAVIRLAAAWTSRKVRANPDLPWRDRPPSDATLDR